MRYVIGLLLILGCESFDAGNTRLNQRPFLQSMKRVEAHPHTAKLPVHFYLKAKDPNFLPCPHPVTLAPVEFNRPPTIDGQSKEWRNLGFMTYDRKGDPSQGADLRTVQMGFDDRFFYFFIASDTANPQHLSINLKFFPTEDQFLSPFMEKSERTGFVKINWDIKSGISKLGNRKIPSSQLRIKPSVKGLELAIAKALIPAQYQDHIKAFDFALSHRKDPSPDRSGFMLYGVNYLGGCWVTMHDKNPKLLTFFDTTNFSDYELFTSIKSMISGSVIIDHLQKKTLQHLDTVPVLISMALEPAGVRHGGGLITLKPRPHPPLTEYRMYNPTVFAQSTRLKTAAHEYAHMYEDWHAGFYQPFPRWLHEGYAQYWDFRALNYISKKWRQKRVIKKHLKHWHDRVRDLRSQGISRPILVRGNEKTEVPDLHDRYPLWWMIVEYLQFINPNKDFLTFLETHSLNDPKDWIALKKYSEEAYQILRAYEKSLHVKPPYRPEAILGRGKKGSMIPTLIRETSYRKK